jgi:pSer/pThr/pTyr-binding forkhead associated (FHA) protein
MDALAKLVIANSTESCGEIPLTDFPLRLGRRPEADVCIDDRWVSREHCEIDFVDDVLVVRDLDSKHGTFVNGRSISRLVLKTGDLLTIGLSKFVVQYEHQTAGQAVCDDALVS